MNPRRPQPRTSFYKYLSPTSGKKVLENGTLRWSSPSLFNDPFDVPKVIFDGITEAQLQEAAARALIALIENPTLPHPEHLDEWTRKLIAMATRASAEEKNALIEIARAETHDDLKFFMKVFQADWVKVHDDHRILCLSESWNSASMWDRYCDGHQGVVLELGGAEQLDSVWFRAKPVIYQDHPLSSNNPDGLVRFFCYEADFALRQLMEEFTHTKTVDWAYEREWRIALWKADHVAPGRHTDHPFAPAELIGVHLGAKMPVAAQQDLTRLVKTRYPDTTIWKTAVGNGRSLNRVRVK